MSTYICFTGGRDYDDTDTVSDLMWYLVHKYGRYTVVHGAAPGADRLVDRAAKLLDLEIKPFVAPWDTQGRKAGAIRNQLMARYMKEKQEEGHEVFVVAFPGGKGTEMMVDMAHKAGLRWYNADALLALLSKDHECRIETAGRVRRRKRSEGALA